MKPGDKIRFTHTKGEGTVIQMLDKGMVEVEIEDGFRIPVLRNELVLVAVEEKTRFGSGFSESKPEPPVTIKDKSKGVFISFVPFNDKIHSLFIVNNSHKEVLFSVSEKFPQTFEGIASGKLNPGTTQKIKEYKIADFETWPEFTVQLLYYKQGKGEYASPLEKRIRFKAANYFKSKKFDQVLQKDAFVYQLDEPASILPPGEEKNIFGDPPKKEIVSIEKPATEVDLHIEKIHQQHKAMNGAEILEFQLRHFEKQLENAIATGLKEITFIHGTGNGTLKNNIHKKLANNMFIEYFEEARKEKFGYGATFVKFK